LASWRDVARIVADLPETAEPTPVWAKAFLADKG